MVLHRLTFSLLLQDRCIIPGCNEDKSLLFRVPNSRSNKFRQWRKVATVYGTGTERICSQHFVDTDFVENIRRKLKTTAIPCNELPVGMIKVADKKACCVAGCRSKNPRRMEKFPSSTSKVWKKWAKLLGCLDINTAGWKMCQKHFKENDFATVTSRYLKSSAVPTKNLKRPVKSTAIHRRRVKQNPMPQCLLDHNYCKEDVRPKSNRMCSVYGCKTKSSKGVFLHQFPNDGVKAKIWMHAVKMGSKPRKNSFVCSQHFHDSDYNSGTNVLKKTAVPSRNIPLTFLQQVQSRTDDPYKRIFESFRRTGDIKCHSDHSMNSNETAENSSLNQTVPLTGSPQAGPSGLHSVNSCHDFATPSILSAELDNCNLNCFNDESLPRKEENEETVHKNILEKTIHTHGKAILSDFLITGKDLTTWTGISSLKLLEVVCEMVRTMEDNVYPKKYKMHTTDRVILTLVKLKQNLSFAALSTIFCVSPTTAAEYFAYTVQTTVAGNENILVYM
ncbi:uncharacterized protein LOC135713539 [Ochlerotatus camptorhynchus]|uniref:uncharacterized protein LOC135713539 n=1 Tax=Ochlerotatus camptorhynchus TaxID=644619 RepID=UPI0031D04D71